MATDEQRDEHAVASRDPSLSAEANLLLTEEAREALGADRVEIRRETPQRSHRREGRRGGLLATLAENRVLVVITFLVVMVSGVIVSLATGSWWAVVAASVAHAIGTFAVLAVVTDRTRAIEHAAPGVAARLEAEGVSDPDRRLTDLVEEYGVNAGPDCGAPLPVALTVAGAVVAIGLFVGLMGVLAGLS